jgi:hypothetical protein
MGMSADPVDTIFEKREPVKKPGWRKALPWVSGVVVVAVGLGLVFVFFRNTGHSSATPLNPNVPAIDVSKIPKTVKLQPGATHVARQFIETAVARKNLEQAYKISGPQIVQGQSLKEWMTGNIAVPPYPVSDVAFAPMKIDYSYPKSALIEIALLPKPKSNIKSQMFMMELDKIGGKWVVNSWVPRAAAFVHSQGGNN